MKDFFEDDNELRAIFKKEGILSTSENFSQKVMTSIESDQKQDIFTYKPLLSRKAGISIFIGILLTSVICWIILNQFSLKELTSPEFINEFVSFFKKFSFSFNVNAKAIEIGTLVIGLICLLLCLDLWINYRSKQSTI